MLLTAKGLFQALFVPGETFRFSFLCKIVGKINIFDLFVHLIVMRVDISERHYAKKRHWS